MPSPPRCYSCSWARGARGRRSKPRRRGSSDSGSSRSSLRMRCRTSWMRRTSFSSANVPPSSTCRCRASSPPTSPPGGSTAGEILRSGAGVIAQIGDADELNRVVARLKEDPEWAGSLGAAGRRYAESSLDSVSAHARIDRLLEQTLTADKPAPAPDWYEVLGVRVNAAPFGEVLGRVLEAPESGERLSLHFATVHTLVESQENEMLRGALRQGLTQPAGMPL